MTLAQVGSIARHSIMKTPTKVLRPSSRRRAEAEAFFAAVQSAGSNAPALLEGAALAERRARIRGGLRGFLPAPLAGVRPVKA